MNEEQLQIKLAETEARARSNTKRLDRLESRQNEWEKLATSVSVMCLEQEHMKRDLQEIKMDVKSLAGKPGRKWESLMDRILFVLAGALVAWFLAPWGL